MTLAEVLAERADLQRRVTQLEHRLSCNALVQEGETPAEDPHELMAELQKVLGRLEEVITLINLTNAGTMDQGETLTALLARRDCMALQVSALRDFLGCASNTTSRATRGEIRVLSTVNVREEQKRLDGLSAQLRQLDLRIQALNWNTYLGT